MENSEDKKKQSLVEVIDGGPLKITGPIMLKDLKRGKEEYADEILLCTCGRSSKKPYCDDSHKK